MDKVIEILQLGFIGFAFLMASLSFRLLYLEQKRAGEPRAAILTSARSYMIYTVALCVLVTGVRALDSFVDDAKARRASMSKQVRVCRDGIEQMEQVGLRQAETLEGLRVEVARSVVGCRESLSAIVGD